MDNEPRRYRTELREFVADLADYIEARLNEADGGSDVTANLTRAGAAVQIIQQRLLDEDQAMHAKLMLLGAFDLPLVSTTPDEQVETIANARSAVEAVRSILSGDG